MYKKTKGKVRTHGWIVTLENKDKLPWPRFHVRSETAASK